MSTTATCPVCKKYDERSRRGRKHTKEEEELHQIHYWAKHREEFVKATQSLGLSDDAMETVDAAILDLKRKHGLL